MMKLRLFSHFFNLLFPDLCVVCGENLMHQEHCICYQCLHQLPKTNYHLTADNPIEKRFWGKVPVAFCTSYFYFHKGSPFQKLLHSLKYNNYKELGEVLGKYAASDLLDAPQWATIDVIVPVPLHPRKYKSRGYNQSEWIGRGLSAVLGKPQDTKSLIRIRENTTQTRKTVFERYENTAGIFDMTDKQALAHKHILLVDDVLTTGSTLEACINALLSIDGVKVSVFTLAVA